MKERLAIVSACGGMYGVYLAGVLKDLAPALENEGVIASTICASSASAWTVPYYLSGQLGAMEMIWLHKACGRQLFNFFNPLFLQPVLQLSRMMDILRRGELRLNLKAMFESPTKFEIGITRWRTGEAFCVEPSRYSLFKKMRASAAVPYFYPPVRIQREWCVDGGLGDPFPIQHALKKHHKVIAIISKPYGAYDDAWALLAKLVAPFLHSAIGLLMRTYERRLQEIDTRYSGDGRVFMIRPREPLSLKSFSDSDARRIARAYDYARDDMRDVSPDLLRWLHVG